MNCEQANRVDLVNFLVMQGIKPVKENSNNCWFRSPLHEDHTPSFKVDRHKNTWYDFGLGIGGTVVDFICELNNCNVATALAKIASAEQINIPSFPRQKIDLSFTENSIQILHLHDQISDVVLRRYFHERKIRIDIAEKFCKQVNYQSGNGTFTAIGFRNNAGGYELRSPNFKGSSSPKFISYMDNEAKSITVFEGFFDFLSYRSIHDGQEPKDSNYLVLNSLSFFTRSLLLIEKHEKIHLYLDNDTAGRKCVQQIKERSKGVSDESTLYKDYKDLNEWSVRFGKEEIQQPSRRLRR